MRTLGLVLLFFVPGTRVIDITAAVSTEKVANQPGYHVIWRNLILAPNRAPAPSGALHVFGLDGKPRQIIEGLDEPTQVDAKGNLAVVAERGKRQLRVYRIDPASNQLNEVGAIPVFEGLTADAALPLGVALYLRPRDSALFALVLHKAQPGGTYLWQYQLSEEGGRVTGKKVREFARYTRTAEPVVVKSVTVDDQEGFVYYSEAACCVHKYRADPEPPGPAFEVARQASDTYQGRRDGIAIAPTWLIVTDRVAGQSLYHVYAKRGAALRPLFALKGPADSTEGIAFAETAPGFPDGLLVASNAAGRNFLLFPLKSRY